MNSMSRNQKKNKIMVHGTKPEYSQRMQKMNKMVSANRIPSAPRALGPKFGDVIYTIASVTLVYLMLPLIIDLFPINKCRSVFNCLLHGRAVTYPLRSFRGNSPNSGLGHCDFGPAFANETYSGSG